MKSLQNGVFFTAAVMLFVVAAVVFWAGFGAQSALELPDPLLRLSVRNVFRLVGTMALGTSGFLLWSRNTELRWRVLAWLSLVLLVYHLGLRWFGGANLFACVGNLGIGVPISPRYLHGSLSTALALLASVSIGALAFHRLQRGRGGTAEPSQEDACQPSRRDRSTVLIP
jgi:hypothetical protein